MLSLPTPIALGSKSPRRQEILDKAGIPYRVLDIDYEEVLPEEQIPWDGIPAYLAHQKALHAVGIGEQEILLTADTLVFFEGKVIGKPKNNDIAFETLKMLSGNMHTVITGVCILHSGQYELFSDVSKVWFKELADDEILYYIDHYPVLDKAGAYGAQDWIGLVGVEKIEGSFFNVMGLPVHKVYEVLERQFGQGSGHKATKAQSGT